ncbi:hypothetical protein CC77DRAFT_752342 [Alternaria alternata]|uniref:Uncharacterized protein n=1 Tax=Alternaria alternata TaxID=5599 RepID=A0A177DQT2_ALTAL|nr:hypothetical protein CC77DRAFT_752342 [Alternaria alternata]OAG21866.1 hypothetical protein CC77DRAFT_752342 [Alternaria alternata]
MSSPLARSLHELSVGYDTFQHATVIHNSVCDAHLHLLPTSSLGVCQVPEHPRVRCDSYVYHAIQPLWCVRPESFTFQQEGAWWMPIERRLASFSMQTLTSHSRHRASRKRQTIFVMIIKRMTLVTRSSGATLAETCWCPCTTSKKQTNNPTQPCSNCTMRTDSVSRFGVANDCESLDGPQKPTTNDRGGACSGRLCQHVRSNDCSIIQ